jgi:hypothetical protein
MDLQQCQLGLLPCKLRMPCGRTMRGRDLFAKMDDEGELTMKETEFAPKLIYY